MVIWTPRKKETAKPGDVNYVTKFAYFPKRMNDGKWVWLEWINIKYEYEYYQDTTTASHGHHWVQKSVRRGE